MPLTLTRWAFSAVEIFYPGVTPFLLHFMAVYTEKEFEFDIYLKLIKAACLNELTLPHLIGNDPMDPISEFLEANPDVAAQIDHLPNGKAPTPAQVRADPLEQGTPFLRLLKKQNLSTEPERVKLSNAWTNWLKGEIHIYRVVSKSLVNYQWLLSLVQDGAGLALLNKLQERNTKDSNELLDSLDEFAIETNEPLDRYRLRLQNLVRKLATCKPKPQPMSGAMQLHAYLRGLSSLQIYEETVAKFKQVNPRTVDKVHAFFLRAYRSNKRVRSPLTHPKNDKKRKSATTHQQDLKKRKSVFNQAKVASSDGPAYIIVCRHGQRLDRFLESAGKEWSRAVREGWFANYRHS